VVKYLNYTFLNGHLPIKLQYVADLIILTLTEFTGYID